jgi:predicted dehydrogenase
MAKTLSRRVLFAGVSALSASARLLPEVRLPQKVRVAILGLDGHVDEILRPLPQLPGVSIVAVSHPDAEALDHLMANPLAHGAARFADWHEMLDHIEADVAAVCNDNGGRAEAVIACLQRGLHVIAEKPLALNSADLMKIRSASEAHNMRVGLLLPMRYQPEYQMMKRVVAEGMIGEVVQIDAQKSYKAGVRQDWYLHRATYGGTIPWLAPHMIDLMRFTSGRDFRESAGYAANVGAARLGDMENVTASVFRLDNGGMATLRMDYLRPEAAPTHGDDRLRLAGLNGVVEFEERTGLTLVTHKESPKRLSEIPAAGSVFVDFLESVYAGKPSDLPLVEILRLSEIVIGTEAAAREHRIVRF